MNNINSFSQNSFANIPQGLPPQPQRGTGLQGIFHRGVNTSVNTLWYGNFSNTAKTNNGKSSYFVTIVLNKADPSIEKIKSAIDAASNDGVKKFGGSFNSPQSPLHDGDIECPQNANAMDYKGKFYIYARSDKLPVVIDEQNNLLQDNDKTHSPIPASFCEGPVHLEFYPYQYNGKNGISCAVKAIQLLRARHLVGDDAVNFAKKIFAQ